MCDPNMAKIQTHSHFGTNTDSCEAKDHNVERITGLPYARKRCNDCGITGECTV